MIQLAKKIVSTYAHWKDLCGIQEFKTGTQYTRHRFNSLPAFSQVTLFFRFLKDLLIQSVRLWLVKLNTEDHQTTVHKLVLIVQLEKNVKVMLLLQFRITIEVSSLARPIIQLNYYNDLIHTVS